jgi:hypothetical protein
VINKLVAKRADQRYESAARLRADLQALQRQAKTPLFSRVFRRLFPPSLLQFRNRPQQRP